MKCRASRSTSRVSHLLLLAVLLLAALLRFYRLDVQSLWNDEGNSARIAERSIDLIVEGAGGDIHPPGYYLLLHYWRALFGQSEFALRSLSAAAGLVLVVFTYLLGRRLFGEAAGLIAAFLGAISPFAIYYSQEARMYALLAALSVASTFFAIRISRFTFYVLRFTFRVSRILHLAAYVLTSAIGLYTHYAFAFVLIAHNVVFALWWVVTRWRSERRWRDLALWAGAQALVIALYSPWLPIALRGATGWSTASQSYRLGPAMVDVLRVLTVGITQPLEGAIPGLVGAGALLVLGLWPGDERDERLRGDEQPNWLGVVSILLYLLIPIAVFFAFDLYKPAWLKFLVIALAPIHILIARGVENLARLTPHVSRFTFYAFLVLAIVLAVSSSLHNLYFDPAYARDDYRQLAADIQAVERASDAIVLNAPNQWEVFTYYHPDEDVHPAPYRPTPEGVERFLAPLVKGYRRLFVLYWGDAESDPRRLIESWLATHAYKAGDRWYGDVRLATYGLASLPKEPRVRLDARFGERIRLRGYVLEEGAFGPGDILPVTLFWEALGEIDEPYKVTVQLLDSEEHLVAQMDTAPHDGLAPTTSWEPGQVIVDRYGVYLPGDASLGRHTLIVAVYHAFSGERLPVTLDGEVVGVHLPLGDVAIGLE